jgi:hypothetical protein
MWQDICLPAAQASGSVEMRTGRVFRYAVPQGWSASESSNGVSVSSPDRSAGAFSIQLVNSRGSMTPAGFVAMMQRLDKTVSTARIVSVQPQPDIPGVGGKPYKVAVVHTYFVSNGLPMEGEFTSAVSNGYGYWSGVMHGYQATPCLFARGKNLLASLSNSVTVINTSSLCMQDQTLRPRNHPFDEMYGSYQRAWHERQKVYDRLSQQQQEVTMGYEPMQDPWTAQTYNMPLNSYDPAAGGYRNPARPYEILVKPRWGQ